MWSTHTLWQTLFWKKCVLIDFSYICLLSIFDFFCTQYLQDQGPNLRSSSSGTGSRMRSSGSSPTRRRRPPRAWGSWRPWAARAARWTRASGTWVGFHGTGVTSEGIWTHLRWIQFFGKNENFSLPEPVLKCKSFGLEDVWDPPLNIFETLH